MTIRTRSEALFTILAKTSPVVDIYLINSIEHEGELL